MKDHRLPKIALYGELSTGHRERRGIEKRNNDCLKMFLIACIVDHLHWSEMASDRDAWGNSTLRAVNEFEKAEETRKKTREAKEKLETPLSLQRTLISSVYTAHGPAFPA